MKLVSLNVWQGRLEKVLLNHLRELDVDFACTQEAVDFSGRSSGLITTYQKIGLAMQMTEQLFSPLMSVRFGDRDMKFGNALYAKTPIKNSATVFTRGEYKQDIDFSIDDYNVRAMQHAEFAIEGYRLHILNHHGHHIDEHKLGDAETKRQITQIVSYIERLDGAVILCGDFNLAPESESIMLLDSLLRNLSVESKLQTTRSALTPKKEVCDYIFTNDKVVVKSYVMDSTIISDHNALILDFDLYQG